MTNSFTKSVPVRKGSGDMAALAVAGGAAIILLAIVIGLLVLMLAAFIVTINLQDIAANGVSFWPVLWILCTLTVLFRGSLKVKK